MLEIPWVADPLVPPARRAVRRKERLVMEFDHNWDPGENDSRTRRWVRRIVFVAGLVLFVWVAAIISGGAIK